MTIPSYISWIIGGIWAAVGVWYIYEFNKRFPVPENERYWNSPTALVLWENAMPTPFRSEDFKTVARMQMYDKNGHIIGANAIGLMANAHLFGLRDFH